VDQQGFPDGAGGGGEGQVFGHRLQGSIGSQGRLTFDWVQRYAWDFRTKHRGALFGVWKMVKVVFTYLKFAFFTDCFSIAFIASFLPFFLLSFFLSFIPSFLPSFLPLHPWFLSFTHVSYFFFIVLHALQNPKKKSGKKSENTFYRISKSLPYDPCSIEV